MFDFSNVQLESVVVHNIGNKAREEELSLSQTPLNLDHDMIRTLLLKYFLSPFKDSTLYNLSHETDISLNELYNYCSNIFENSDSVYENSIHIAKHLYEQSQHPKIKSGELYVVYLKDCVLEDELVDAIGIFKSENKDTYLKVERKEDAFVVRYDSGININKLDKGCLIFNTDKEQGFVLAIIDSNSKNAEAVFWKDDFLKVEPRKDYHYYTKNYMNLCKEFIEDTLPNEERNEQMELQQKTVHFFAEEQTFDIEKFEEEVLQIPEKIEQFRKYKEEFQAEKQIEIPKDFKISAPAMKNAKKQFKNLIKLDNHFQIHILNPNAVFKRGFDELLGQKYYQFFFDEEN